MTTFHDGPAQGKPLMLRRCPLYLRVVIAGGQIDGLDQIDDTPAPAEAVFAYIRQPGAMMKAVHLNTGRKGGGGWFCRADYRLSPVQPSDTEARDNTLWRQWCEHQVSQKQTL